MRLREYYGYGSKRLQKYPVHRSIWSRCLTAGSIKYYGKGNYRPQKELNIK